MFTITFNEETALDHGVHIVKRPGIPVPEEDVTETEIPGRDGVLIERSGRYKPITIEVEMNFLSSSADTWWETFREVNEWLSGSGTLVLGDNEDYFYSVYYVLIADSERSIKRLGTFTAQFVCDPYQYLIAGQEECSYSDVLTNNYAVCHPVYKISGSGTCTLTVNGNTMTAYAKTLLYIDTERMLAYTTGGTISNTSVTGNYDDLYLQEGTNTITITSGYTLTVIPNWRRL